ncbi:uncharacterized protein LOC127464118 isoform X32 [Manacus candei]|uniref:uncharacterized protein LOC127464118 isoform X29 n=1 Tax=Manacus candei TaxID=415023 RepID=UPI002226BF25|nr:uncharacterized protein LOC127464118 isoform X29 [Manacus candei]XP_051630226.1 uncharacterized protein LOC127464118 isoform X32 [Manacus candei]
MNLKWKSWKLSGREWLSCRGWTPRSVGFAQGFGMSWMNRCHRSRLRSVGFAQGFGMSWMNRRHRSRLRSVGFGEQPPARVRWVPLTPRAGGSGSSGKSVGIVDWKSKLWEGGGILRVLFRLGVGEVDVTPGTPSGCPSPGSSRSSRRVLGKRSRILNHLQGILSGQNPGNFCALPFAGWSLGGKVWVGVQEVLVPRLGNSNPHSEPFRWSQNSSGGAKTLQVEPKLFRWSQNPSDGTKTLQMEPKSFRWNQNPSDGAKILQMEPKLFRWIQNPSGGVRTLQVESEPLKWNQKPSGGAKTLQVESEPLKWNQKPSGGAKTLQVEPKFFRWSQQALRDNRARDMTWLETQPGSPPFSAWVGI